jgi:hypothetical protein
MDPLGPSRVLVLVKAAPQPSRQYGDTVCVAGIDLDAPEPCWVRLYPVPFRYLEGGRQFKKYDIITVRTRHAGGDKRPESRKIEATSIQTTAHVTGWNHRASRVEGLRSVTMCRLVEQAQSDVNSQSLAAVRPARVHGPEFSAHPGWTPEQVARFEDYKNQGDLFRDAPSQFLDPPRLNVQLSYDCTAEGCRGHLQRIIDWELTALQRKYRGRNDSDLKAAITRNFFEVPFGPERAPMIFVGNQENIRRRASFTVLGLYYPKRSDIQQTDALF